jgi:hypothetical protein
MRLIFIIVLSMLAFKLQATDLPAPLMEDEWTIKSDFLSIHPSQFVSKLTRDELIKTPAWQQDSEFPPLSPRKAEDLAIAILHNIMGGRNWTQPDISLQAFDVRRGSNSYRDVRWIYVLHFGLLGEKAYEGGSFNIIVLMDGTAIVPKPVK